jgi:4-alpha-glucanotransferase
MQYGNIEHFQSGVAVPLSSVYSADSCGIGEFADLVPLGKWCRENQLDLIQILPVNDTGEERSPYSARSAFALHPVYMRPADIAGSDAFLAEIVDAQKKYQAGNHVAFREVVLWKRELFAKIYKTQESALAKNADLQSWIEANPWVRAYAVYCVLKEVNEERSWKDWTQNKAITADEINEFWQQQTNAVLFHAWMQWEAEKQFRQAVKALDELGVRLKGDIPILINEDSADVWANPEFFSLGNRAGAPPDMFSFTGQNWGFPCYRWDVLEEHGYSWWRERLQQAAKFYHAYRIDHVLGFFRIWSVPEEQHTGILGHFVPSIAITEKEFTDAGLPALTLEYLKEPNFDINWLNSVLKNHAQQAYDEFMEVLPGSAGKRLRLRPQYANENAIIALDIEQDLKDALLRVYWNRVFTPDSTAENYQPFWYWYDAPVLTTLPRHEQELVQNIIRKNEAERENIWREQGLRLLKMMADETDMLVCAEDLGAVPDCVPDVLQELDILGLKIERWARDWAVSGQPYQDPANYPRLSVCSSASHDSSTLAGWWEESGTDLGYYCETIGLDTSSAKLTPEIAAYILKRLLLSNSLLAIFPIQDYMTLVAGYTPEDPEQERINIPGTLDDTNWTWKMPVSLEDLQADKSLVQALSSLLKERRGRSLT